VIGGGDQAGEKTVPFGPVERVADDGLEFYQRGRSAVKTLLPNVGQGTGISGNRVEVSVSGPGDGTGPKTVVMGGEHFAAVGCPLAAAGSAGRMLTSDRLLRGIATRVVRAAAQRFQPPVQGCTSGRTAAAGRRGV